MLQPLHFITIVVEKWQSSNEVSSLEQRAYPNESRCLASLLFPGGGSGGLP